MVCMISQTKVPVCPLGKGFYIDVNPRTARFASRMLTRRFLICTHSNKYTLMLIPATPPLPGLPLPTGGK